MNPRIKATSRHSHLRYSFTPPAGVQKTAGTVTGTNVDSDCATSRSEASYATLPNKRKSNPLRNGFSSLRKSAKNLFKLKSQSQEFEDDQSSSVPSGPQQVDQTFRVPVAEVAARFEEPRRPTRTVPFEASQIDIVPTTAVPFDSPRADFVPTPTAFFETPQVDFLDRSSATSSPAHTSPTTGHALIEFSDTLPQTEFIHEIPSLIVFTPPASAQVCTPSSSTPPTPPPKIEHVPFDLEAVLKDIRSQAVALPTPTHRSPYLDGVVVYFKSIVLALASVGICAMALPWACLALISSPKTASKREESGNRNTVPEAETHVVKPMPSKEEL